MTDPIPSRSHVQNTPIPAVRGWAILDLAITGCFALPPLHPPFFQLVYGLNGLLGGSPTPAPMHPLSAFFVCLAGALGVLWAWARLRAPTQALGTYDSMGRLWVVGLIVYYVSIAGAPRVLLLFVLSEMGGALHQWRRIRELC